MTFIEMTEINPVPDGCASLPPALRTSLSEILARADIWRGHAGNPGDFCTGAGEAGVVPRAGHLISPTLSCSSGFSELDDQLPGGGWPGGQLVELLHDQAGIGELSLLLPGLCRGTGAGKRIALILPSDAPWQVSAPGWQRAGAESNRLLVIRPGSVRDALWATVQCLRCPGISATLSWLEGSDAWLRGPRARALATNSLRRLQVAAATGGGMAFLFRPRGCAREASPAPLRLTLEPWRGGLQIELIKRRGMSARHPVWLPLPRPCSPLRDRHALVRPDGALADTRSVVAA